MKTENKIKKILKSMSLNLIATVHSPDSTKCRFTFYVIRPSSSKELSKNLDLRLVSLIKELKHYELVPVKYFLKGNKKFYFGPRCYDLHVNFEFKHLKKTNI